MIIESGLIVYLILIGMDAFDLDFLAWILCLFIGLAVGYRVFIVLRKPVEEWELLDWLIIIYLLIA